MKPMTYLNLIGCGPSDKVSAIFDGRIRIEAVSCSVSPSERKKPFTARLPIRISTSRNSRQARSGHCAGLQDDLKRAQSVMGPDVWPYGVPDNRKELEAMFRYSVEQGLAPRKIELEEFFAPGTLHRWQGKD
jgi:hypothetical protein